MRPPPPPADPPADPPAVGRWIAAGVLSCVFALLLFASVYIAHSSSSSSSSSSASSTDAVSSSWVLLCSIALFMMPPGFAVFYGGMSKSKNQLSTILKCMLPMAVVPMLWSVVGFSLAFGDDVGRAGLFGSPASYGIMRNVGFQHAHVITQADRGEQARASSALPVIVFFTYQMQFAIVAPCIMIGAIAARVRFDALCVLTALWHLVVYCPMAHMVWHADGIVYSWGVCDFAGGLAVHLAAGFAALVCAWYVRPACTDDGDARATRFADAIGEPMASVWGPSDVPTALLGTSLIGMGWFGFTAGNALAPSHAAAQAFINTQLAFSASAACYQVVDYMRGRQVQATRVCLGALIGLVCVTPASGFVDVSAAALIGLAGAVCCSVAEMLVGSDDRGLNGDMHVFAHHGVGGAVGVLCTALFASATVDRGGVDGAVAGDWLGVAKAALVLLLAAAWVMLATLGCLWTTERVFRLRLRVTAAEEVAGLDMASHGENATAVGAAVAEMDFGGTEAMAVISMESGYL